MRASDCPTVDTTEFLLAALEQASEAVVIVDGDLRISHFNAAAELIWGVPRTEVLGCDARGLGFNDLQNGADFRDHDPAQRRQPDPGSAIGVACRDRGPSQLHGLRS